jgi:hypothetical protein
MHSESAVTKEDEGESSTGDSGREERRDKEEEYGEIRKRSTVRQGRRVRRDEEWVWG